MKINKNILLLNVYTFLSTFILFYICDTLYYLENGISSSKYITFVIISFFIQFFLEIPSGILADKYDKKKILIISEMLFIISTLIFIYLRTYLFFVIAIIIKTISSCIITGIVNSLLYESCYDKNDFSKILFLKSTSYNLSYMSAMIVGGFVAEKMGLISTYYISLIPAFINLIIIMMLNVKKIGIKNKINLNKDILKNAFKELKNNKNIFNAIITSSVMFSIIKLVEESHPEYASNIGISVSIIGIYTAFILVFCIIGSYIGTRVNKKNYDFVLKYNALFVGILIFLIGFVNNKVFIIFLLLIYIFSESFDNILITKVHNHVSSDSRVTSESIVSMILCLFGMFFSLITSCMLNYFEIYQTYMILGIIIVLYSIINIGINKFNN